MSCFIKSAAGKTIRYFAFIFFASILQPAIAMDYREEMRNLVREISEYSKNIKNGFIIIPQNGLDVAFSNDGKKVEKSYMDYIDGVGQESIIFGYPKDNLLTPKAMSEYLGWLCKIFKENGKQVLAIDYCSDKKSMDLSYSINMRNGFISFAASDRLLRTIPSYPESPYNSNAENIINISNAKNFLYLINGEKFSSKTNFINAVKNTDYDFVISDLFQNEEQFDSFEVAELKTKKNGGKRLAICYMSIGEAEDYRYYWNPKWKRNKPSWLSKENPSWNGNYKVKYWDKEWKSILFGNPDAYLDRILSAGFDGVYLDIIDAFEYFEAK